MRPEPSLGTEQISAGVVPQSLEELPKQGATELSARVVTERMTVDEPVESLDAPVENTHRELESAEEILQASPVESGLRVDLAEAIHPIDTLGKTTELEPPLSLPEVRVPYVASEQWRTQESVSGTLLIEALVVKQIDNEQLSGPEPIMLMTLDDVFEYASQRSEAAGQAISERVEEAVVAVEQAAADFIAVEVLGSTAPEAVDEIIAERIDALLDGLSEMPGTVDGLMAQLEAMDDTEPELRELLVASLELMQSLGVEDPTVSQVTSLARALVVYVADKRQALIALAVEDRWTEDRSIAGERYGLFGARRLPSLVSAAAEYPLGQFALRASLVGV